MTDADIQALFDEARQEPIASVCPTKLYRSGHQLRGECPLCHSGAGKGKGGNFSVNPAKNLWYCFGGCGDGGDVIELEHRLNSTGSETRLDAARRLATGNFPGDRKPAAARPATVKVFVPEERRGWTFEHAQRLWKEGLPSEGTLVQRYLVWRGFRGWVLKAMLKHLRFHPMAYHSGPSHDPYAFPAMLGRVFAPAGPTGGTHATYLRIDGLGKADIPGASSKVMWGPQSRDGQPGGVWLTHPYAPGPLAVAEGIESTGSVAQLREERCRMVAALSLDRLQGGWLADALGHKDPDCPRPDPDRPGFTWPEPLAPIASDSTTAPAAPWGQIIIGVDHDMSPMPVKVRGRDGRTADRLLTTMERARICGALASASWKRTTKAEILVALPPPGRDWNKVLMDRVA